MDANIDIQATTECLKSITHIEKLQAIIDQAVKCGWKSELYSYVKSQSENLDYSEETNCLVAWDYENTEWISVDSIIFDHSFARAFWGDLKIGHMEQWKWELKDLALIEPSKRIDWLYEQLK